MVEIYDEEGKALFLRLLELNPGLEVEIEAGNSSDPRHIIHPRIQVPSAHPTIRTPLTIELGGYLQLFWNGSYLFDFPWEQAATHAFDFLQRFFAEEVLCMLCWRDGKVVAGGPAQLGEGTPELRHYDRIELRSWRGTHDLVTER